ncbi:hypothetical protein, unknown function [Leishmania tarentolae]|uniref:Uncharacterized protein n=1 Tax=Leishmania tarentolae TaxID=5689 RepID=A0A640KZI6_LEITA|nr:hypothetical protein, unknown function [Leishmania tarentolae]
MESNQSTVTPTRSIYQLLNYGNGLEELLLVYWWVIVLGNLILFAFAKHSLMCWELHRDRRRLKYCYMRHCQRRRAALPLESATADTSQGTQAQKAASTTGNAPIATSSSIDPTETGAATKNAADCIIKSERKIRLSIIASKQHEDVAPPKTAEVTEKVEEFPKRSEQQEITASVHEKDTRTLSLLRPLHSITSSDITFSSSSLSAPHASTSATTRLLNRFGFMSPDANHSNDEKVDTRQCSSSSTGSSRLSNCCPRYTEDEQRLIHKKRQENVRAWMEAKRALELTESLAAESRGVIPLSSISAREFQPCRKGSIETELVS